LKSFSVSSAILSGLRVQLFPFFEVRAVTARPRFFSLNKSGLSFRTWLAQAGDESLFAARVSFAFLIADRRSLITDYRLLITDSRHSSRTTRHSLNTA